MKVLKWLDENIEKVILIFLLAVIAVVMMIAVISRYVFKNGLTWSDEICRLAFIFSVFWGTSFSIKKNTAFRLTSIIDKFPPTARFITELVIDVFVIAFLGYVSYYFVSSALTFARLHNNTEILRIPRVIIYMIISIAMILSTYRTIRKLIVDIRNGKKVFTT